MLYPDCEASSSSERRREPEHTSRTPKPDATTDEQTQRPDPSLADRPKRTCRPYRRSHRPDSGAVAERDGAGRLDRVPGEQPMAFAPRRVQGTHRQANAPSAQPHERGSPLDAPAQHHRFAQPAHASRHEHQRAPRFAQACQPRGATPMPAPRRATVYSLPRAERRLLEVRPPPSP